MEGMRQVLAGVGLVLGLGLIGTAVVGCKQAAPPMPLEQLNAQQTAGHAVFQARCAVCHSDRTEQKRNGPSMLGVFKRGSLHSGAAATDERVTATVLHGHGTMPAMGNVVQGQDLEDLLAYLHTL